MLKPQSKPLVDGHNVSHATHVLGILGFLYEWLRYPNPQHPSPYVQGRWIASDNSQKAIIQKWVVDQLPGYEEILPQIKELVKGMSSQKASEINTFLAKEGFDIRLDDWGDDPSMFGAASIFRLLVSWKKPGIKGLTVRDEYPAFQIDYKKQGLLFGQIEEEEFPTLIIPCGNGKDFVFIHPRCKHVGSVEATSDLVRSIVNIPIGSVDFDTAIIPCVDLDVQPDVSWLTGLSRSGLPTSPGSELVQVKQQVRAKMNYKGAFVESATAGGMRCMAFVQSPKIFIVDHPFYMVFARQIGDNKIPLASIRVGTDHWKDPGEFHF